MEVRNNDIISIDSYTCNHSLDNDAERMFAEMTEKDGITYSAIIQGLAKVRSCNIL